MSDLKQFEHLKIPLEAIKAATNNFSDECLIGNGGFGKVYKGEIVHSKGKTVAALKRLDRRFGQGDPQFWKEIMMLSQYKHTNIVSLLGYCDDCDEKILVYEYAPKTSLDRYLNSSELNWVQRLKICIGVAQGLAYLHDAAGTTQQRILHRDIKSSNIILDDNWNAKIADFGLSKFGPANQKFTFMISEAVGTPGYVDPLYAETGILTKESDVFSFGVVLFEVLCGRLCFGYKDYKNQPLIGLARQSYEQNSIKEIICDNIKDEIDRDSLQVFAEIAYQCLKRERQERPEMSLIVTRLETALQCQWESFEHLKIPLKDIISATENFNQKYKIGSGGFGTVYKAELEYFDSRNSSALEEGDDGVGIRKICSTVAIKCIREDVIGEQGFIAEVKMLSNCKHPNIVSLLGFCDEGPQKILIYEYIPNGSLDSYLEHSYKMINLTWGIRLQICLDIARGLDYLHSGLNNNEIIIHRDIKSANILLDNNLRAKIADFGLSRLHTLNPNMSTVNTGNLAGTSIYLDPEYMKAGKLKRASDIYSFGVVLFEILSGTLAYDEIHNTESEKGLPSRAHRLHKEGSLNDIVDSNIIETDGSILSQTRRADQNSLDTILNIAIQCLAKTQEERPKLKNVIRELENALYFQLHTEPIKGETISTFPPLPKFGDWDLYEPASADGFTVIFNKARNEIKTGGSVQSPPNKDSMYNKHETATFGKPQSKKWFCCIA